MNIKDSKTREGEHTNETVGQTSLDLFAPNGDMRFSNDRLYGPNGMMME
jgi:hypothetical protein